MRFCQWTCGDMGNCATGALFHTAAFGSSAGIVPFTIAARTATLSCAIVGCAIRVTKLIATTPNGQNRACTFFIALLSPLPRTLHSGPKGRLPCAHIERAPLLSCAFYEHGKRPFDHPLIPMSEAIDALRHTHP